MTTPALRDTFATTSTELIAGHVADSGHTWSNATSTGQSRPMSVGSTGGAFCADPSTTDGFSAISSWTPPSANYGFAARCQFLDASRLEAGIGVRVSVTAGASGLLGYFGQMSTAANAYIIARGQASTFTTLATVAHTFAAGEQHDLYLTATNNSSGGVDLVLSVDEVATVTYTDPASASPILTAGSACLRGYSPSGTTTTGAHVLWAQTDPPAPTPPIPAPTYGQLVVQYPTPSLVSVYFAIFRTPGQLWNGSAFDPIAAARWSTYAIPAVDPGGAGFYLADFPAAIPAGTYSAYAYRRTGAAPAAGDPAIGLQADRPWDGSTF